MGMALRTQCKTLLVLLSKLMYNQFQYEKTYKGNVQIGRLLITPLILPTSEPPCPNPTVLFSILGPWVKTTRSVNPNVPCRSTYSYGIHLFVVYLEINVPRTHIL